MPKKAHNGVERTQPQKESITKESVTFLRSVDFRSIYANYARINFNAFDVSMLFGQAGVAPEQQDKIAIEMTTRVTMGVVEAKLLIQMLTRIVGAFEQKYGPVEIPDDVRLPVEVAKEGV